MTFLNSIKRCAVSLQQMSFLWLWCLPL